MKVTELEQDNYYACYKTWGNIIDDSIVIIVRVDNIRKNTDYNFYEIHGEITVCDFSRCSREYGSIAIYPETEFKEITEKQYAEILNKYKALYSATQKLME